MLSTTFRENKSMLEPGARKMKMVALENISSKPHVFSNCYSSQTGMLTRFVSKFRAEPEVFGGHVGDRIIFVIVI